MMKIRNILLGLALFNTIGAEPPKPNPAVADPFSDGNDSQSTEAYEESTSKYPAPEIIVSQSDADKIFGQSLLPSQTEQKYINNITHEHTTLSDDQTLKLELCLDHLTSGSCENAPLEQRATLIHMIGQQTTSSKLTEVNLISFGSGKLVTEYLLAEELINHGAQSVNFHIIDLIYDGEGTSSSNTKGLTIPLGKALKFGEFIFENPAQADLALTQRIQKIDEKVTLFAYKTAQNFVATFSAPQWASINFLIWVDGKTGDLTQGRAFNSLKQLMPLYSHVHTLANGSIKCATTTQIKELSHQKYENDDEFSSAESSSEYSSEEEPTA